MRGKILFATGLAVGYVLGTRAGRERYEQLKRAAQGFWNDPRVQRRVDQVEGFVRENAAEVVEFVSDGAKKVVGQVTGAGRASATSAAAGPSAAAQPAATSASKPAAKRRTTATTKPAAKRSTASGSTS
jgi:hypothetical protein